MAGAVVKIYGQGVSFLMTPPWELQTPWDEPQVQEGHGVWLALPGTTFGIGVRAGPDPSPPYTASPEGIERYLFAQGWASGPFDILRWEEPPLVGVAGTFHTPNEGEHVREWYVTDGERIAECTAAGPSVDLSKWLPECERLARSVRIHPVPVGENPSGGAA